MVLKKRSKAFYFATICTVASVIGAIVGYYIGVYAINLIMPMLNKFNYIPELYTAEKYFNTYGVWIILIAGFSPIPYKLFTITAGMMAMPIIPFVVFSLIARGARYFLISYLVRKLGKMADTWLNKYIDWLGYLLIIIIVFLLLYAH
tara:strand:+ start:278 stop:718 length:441 start_codon:yes stop_codon:yes gene_type:complete